MYKGIFVNKNEIKTKSENKVKNDKVDNKIKEIEEVWGDDEV